MNRIEVLSLNKKFKKFEKSLSQAVKKALKILRKDGFTASFYFVSDDQMRALNRKFRRKNRPTNVLAFPEPKGFPHPETKTRPLGEVYLAPDFVLRRQEDLGRLAVHGLLHLLGFSHKRKSDRIKMEKLEKKIATRIRYG